MTHPSEGRKLTDNEIHSISNAVKEAGIQQIHPDKMEAFADSMVEKLKEEPSTALKGQATAEKGWRTCDPLSE
jgi:hypothetical protein